MALDLTYDVFDFGTRAGRISAAKAEVLVANFAFNDVHRNVIFEVEQAYYRLLNALGQEDAARGGPGGGIQDFKDSLERLERTVQASLSTEPQEAMATRLRTFVSLCRRIENLTISLAS